MKIVVLDGYTENPGDLSWSGLEALGEVTVYDRTSYVDDPIIAERIGDAEIVVLNKTPISKATIDACPNMKMIAVLATGYNVVDYEYAKEKGIPVKWAIIDDMWGEVHDFYDTKYESRSEMFRLMHSSRLYSFKADPRRFPNGLKGCIDKMKEYGITVGMWHPTTGYWMGIDPEGEIYRDHKDCLIQTEDGRFIHSPETGKAYEFYSAFHDYFRQCGAEFVKIDNSDGRFIVVLDGYPKDISIYGFEKTPMIVKDKTLSEGWKYNAELVAYNNAAAEYYLLGGISESGVVTWYVYDHVMDTYQRYFVQPANLIEKESGPVLSLTEQEQQVKELNEALQKTKNARLLVIGVLAFISLVLLIATINLALKVSFLKKEMNGDDETVEDEDDSYFEVFEEEKEKTTPKYERVVKPREPRTLSKVKVEEPTEEVGKVEEAEKAIKESKPVEKAKEMPKETVMMKKSVPATIVSSLLVVIVRQILITSGNDIRTESLAQLVAMVLVTGLCTWFVFQKRVDRIA